MKLRMLRSSVRWRSSVLLIIPILAIAAVTMTFISARDSHLNPQVGRKEVEGLASHAGKDSANTGEDRARDRPGSQPSARLDLRREEYSHWEAKALSAMRDGTLKDTRKMFKLIQAFGALLPRIQHVTKMATPSVEVFRNYIAPAGLPVVFTDLYKSHPLRQWSWESLKKQYGHLRYDDVRQGTLHNDTSSFGKRNVNRVSVKLSDFIDLVSGARKARGSAEEGLYIAKKQLLPKEAVQKEFPYPPFYSGTMETCFTEPSSWFGMAGTITQGHIDARDNFAYHVIGRKRWHLYSPQDFKYLYFTHLKGALEWSKALGEFPANLAKYPFVKKAQPLTVTLEEGEVLYLPRGWVHVVENITPALMLNIWRKGPPEFLASWSEKYRQEIAHLCDKAS